MDETAFMERARQRLGPLAADEADRAIGTALRVLGEACSRRLADRLARALPGDLGELVATSAVHDLAGDLDALAARAARREGISVALAREHVTAVGSVIGECVDDELLALAASELQPSVVALLKPREVAAPPREPVHAPSGSRPTLPDRGPGSASPVTAARARATRKR